MEAPGVGAAPFDGPLPEFTTTGVPPDAGTVGVPIEPPEGVGALPLPPLLLVGDGCGVGPEELVGVGAAPPLPPPTPPLLLVGAGVVGALLGVLLPPLAGVGWDVGAVAAVGAVGPGAGVGSIPVVCWDGGSGPVLTVPAPQTRTPP